MKQKALPIAVSSLLLGLIFDWFFFEKVPGVSVFLYTFLTLSFTAYFVWQFRKPLNPSLYWLAPLALFFSFMVFVRANPFLTFVNCCLTLYLLLMVVRMTQQPSLKLQQFGISHYFTVAFTTPIDIARRAVQFVLSPLTRRPTTAKAAYVPVIRGILLSLPILFVFLLLLSSADLVFKQFVDSVFDFSINPETVFRWGLIGFVASLFAGAYALMFLPSSGSQMMVSSNRAGFKLGATEATVILGSVSGLFLMFVMIQLAYLFGGADQIASTGYTYAEYARKGFFELIAVATISLALILAVKKSVTSHSSALKWLSSALIVEVLVIMLSAHMRLNLYEDAYGFTTLRLWSHLFIGWLALAFGLLLFHTLRDKGEQHFTFHLFVGALGFFVLINLINPDGFIARQNIDRFHDTGKLDLDYLSNLSEDATPAITDLLDNPDERVQKSAANMLYQQKQARAQDAEHWQSVNVARERADQIFQDNADQIDASKSYNNYPKLQ